MPKQKRQRPRARKPVLAFNHAMVYVRDLEPALYFYGQLLGFKLIECIRGKGFPGYARLRSPVGRTTIALHEREPGQQPAEPSGIRLYFEVNELERLCKQLAAERVEIQQMPKRMPWGWKHAYLKDPDGHELSLYWAGAKRLRRTR